MLLAISAVIPRASRRQFPPNAAILARIQFAFTASFHIIFPTISIELALDSPVTDFGIPSQLDFCANEKPAPCRQVTHGNLTCALFFIIRYPQPTIFQFIFVLPLQERPGKRGAQLRPTFFEFFLLQSLDE